MRSLKIVLYRRKDEAQKLRLNLALRYQPTVMDFRDKSDENVPRMRQERMTYLMGNTLQDIAYM